jgi:DNA-binding MarR family transcriptional regulator
VTAESATSTLSATLEDVVSFVRRLPTSPTLSLNAAAVLRACAVDGPQRISAVAERLGVTQPGATQIVDRMAREGWVARSTDARDRRVVLVAITVAGSEVLRHRRNHRAEALDAVLGRLSQQDQDQIRRSVPALARLTRLVS